MITSRSMNDWHLGQCDACPESEAMVHTVIDTDTNWNDSGEERATAFTLCPSHTIDNE